VETTGLSSPKAHNIPAGDVNAGNGSLGQVFDHVGIAVSDLAASERFYRTVLSVLGVEPRHADAELVEWDDWDIGATDPEHPVTRGLHVGFRARDRAQVDAFWQAGIDAGYRDDGAPGPRTQYGPTYYGGFLLDPDSRVVEAGQVVVATGPFEVPRIPEFVRNLDPAVVQMHSTDYRNPGAIPKGTVLVVGGGNTGFQIAEELASTRQVHLSVGTRQTPLPQRLLGRDLFWWLVKSRLLGASVDSRLGRRLQYKDTLIGSSPRRAKRRGVVLRPRTAGAAGQTITLADESTLVVDAVIWATGYVFDRSWIDVPVENEEGRVRHRRGVTDTKGLYFLGLPWQHTRGSALLGWVKDDAAYIAEQIAAAA
jgi:catechol 2,3-dioxygenase-like lactoylglutathione lyase family enzyme